MVRGVAGQKKQQSVSSWGQYRPKRKNRLDSSDYELRLRECAHLESNDTLMEDVQKVEQVGITWMDMAPFVDSAPKFRSGIADVVSVPEEIRDLDDLSELLSYEVWTKCLSQSERELLGQFLPQGTGAEEAVRSLLNGENLHFGNPVIKWSTALCSGDFGPDAVTCKSHQIIAKRRTYYSELKKYHFGMLDVLCRWKERWISCKNPETLLREGPIKQDTYSLTKLKGWDKGSSLNSTKEACVPSSTRRVKGAPLSKRELPPIICIRHNGGTKRVKISDEQYKLIKKLKPSGNGIPLKSLRYVLGDFKHFHACNTSEEEEKRMHERWLQLATKDIPEAFKYHRYSNLQRKRWGKTMQKELAEKRRSIMFMDEEASNLGASPQEQANTGDCANTSKDIYPGCILSLDARQEVRYLVSDQITTGSISDCLYQPISDPHGYVSAAGMSLNQPQPIEECYVPINNVEERILQETTSAAAPLHPASYSNGQCNYLRQPELHHQMTNNCCLELGMLQMTNNCCSGSNMNSPFDISLSEQFMQGTNHTRGVNHSHGFQRQFTHQSPFFKPRFQGSIL